MINLHNHYQWQTHNSRPLLKNCFRLCHFVLVKINTLANYFASACRNSLKAQISTVNCQLKCTFKAGDTDEGPVSKRKHQESEEGASSSKKPEFLPHNSIADTLLCSICQVRLLRFYHSTCKGFCSCSQLSVLQICQLLKIFTSVPVFLNECSFLDPSLNYYIY